MQIDDKKFKYYAAALLSIVTLLVYSNTFNVPFQFDDIYHIVQKDNIKTFSTFGKMSFWTNIGQRPLPMLTLAINYHWGDINVIGYHIFNLIFHITTGWIIYLLILEILSLPTLASYKRIVANKRYFALLASFLFLVHPMQTQAVTYVIQRITILASLFYLLSVYFYIKARLANINKGLQKESILFYWLTLASFILAVLSKQNAVTLPLALIMTEFFFIRDKQGRIFKKYLLIFGSAIGVIVLGAIIIEGLPRESKDISRGTYLITEFNVLIKYIQMLVLPVKQNLDHDIIPSESLFGLKELASLAAILGLLYLGYYMFNKNRLISFGIFWFFLTLSVESTIIPIKDFIFEHRIYLPSFGFFIAVISALFYLKDLKFGKNRIAAAVILLAILIIPYGVAAFARNKVWKTDLALWTDAVNKSPKKGRPYLWQGIAYTNAGDLKEAKKSLDRCIQLLPKFPMAYYNRGNILKEMKEYKGSLADFDKAIALNPTYTMAYFNRGVVRAKIGQYDLAAKDYDEVLKVQRNNSSAYYNRGNAYRNLKKYDLAIKDYDKAIKIDPKYALSYFNRGLTKAAKNNHEEAIRDFDKAIQLNPKNHLIYNGKGVSLYTMKKFNEAISNYEIAIRLNPSFGQAYYNRGFARYMGLDDKDGACQDWFKSQELGYSASKGPIKQYCAIKNTKK